MRARIAATLSLLLACTPETGTSSDGGTDTTGGPTSFPGSGSTDDPTVAPTTSSGTGTGTGTATGEDPTTGGPAMSEDEILLRKAIAGEVDPVDAMQTISDRGGHPVATAVGGFLFACLCGPGSWNLAGDHNGWTPAPMAMAGPLWWIEADVADPDGSLYKFHDPDQAAWIPDPLARRYGFDDNGRYTLVRASAAHLERWYAIDGTDFDLPPRDLQVWVPEGGAFTHMLFAHDGQNLFDSGPTVPWGGWHLQDALPPGVLVVGIDNTGALRLDDYTHVQDDIGSGLIGGKGEAYADLVDTVIRPRMEAAYGPAAVVGTMGSSLGGLISLVIADRFPTRYDMAISMSGTVGWGSFGLHNETILERYAAKGKRDFVVYLDSGGAGPCADADMDGLEDDTDDFDNYCVNAQMEATLEKLGYTPDVDLFYVYVPDADHNELEWAARVDVPLGVFAGL